MKKPTAPRDLHGRAMVQMGQAMYPWDVDKVHTKHNIYYKNLVEVG